MSLSQDKLIVVPLEKTWTLGLMHDQVHPSAHPWCEELVWLHSHQAFWKAEIPRRTLDINTNPITWIRGGRGAWFKDKIKSKVAILWTVTIIHLYQTAKDIWSSCLSSCFLAQLHIHDSALRCVSHIKWSLGELTWRGRLTCLIFLCSSCPGPGSNKWTQLFELSMT